MTHSLLNIFIPYFYTFIWCLVLCCFHLLCTKTTFISVLVAKFYPLWKELPYVLPTIRNVSVFGFDSRILVPWSLLILGFRWYIFIEGEHTTGGSQLEGNLSVIVSKWNNDKIFV